MHQTPPDADKAACKLPSCCRILPAAASNWWPDYLQRAGREDGYSVLDPQSMLAAFQDLGSRYLPQPQKLLQAQWRSGLIQSSCGSVKWKSCGCKAGGARCRAGRWRQAVQG